MNKMMFENDIIKLLLEFDVTNLRNSTEQDYSFVNSGVMSQK